MPVIQSSPLPPSYSNPSINNIIQGSSRLSDLPAYSQMVPTRPTYQAIPKTFEYELKYKGKPIAVMTIIAEEAFSKHLPTFPEHSPIKGRVKLTFDKPDAVQAVVVSAYGQIVTGASAVEKLTFVNVSSTLWSPIMGNPRSLSISDSATGSNSGTSTARFTSKLEGEYSWDFSLDLPKEVVVPSGLRNDLHIFSLPQTFYERHTRVKVTYEVVVRIVRGKLRTDHRIAAPFGYIPIRRPGPFSSLRRLAYEEGTPLPGPTIDPTGWHAQKQIRIQGKMFKSRSVDMGCTLFLAKPLCYTKGSVIPLVLLLESQDLQALDLFSSSTSIVVRLRRLIRYHWVTGDRIFESPGWKDAIEYSHLATWWRQTETSADDSSKRYINGELHLASDLKPTSAMAHFRLEYAVVILPFDIIGFESANNEPLLVQPVEIGTAFGLGPHPIMFAPPEYESSDPLR
ncbi:hypothetical protein BYT27DRAFT_7172935 [Phlegmacium glaucopus]|nr:hypothetical protein BYT27DRAFT_7172935 [Phlegmacium glaucopus]